MVWCPPAPDSGASACRPHEERGDDAASHKARRDEDGAQNKEVADLTPFLQLLREAGLSAPRGIVLPLDAQSRAKACEDGVSRLKNGVRNCRWSVHGIERWDGEPAAEEEAAAFSGVARRLH